MMYQSLPFIALLPLASAHFQLNWPPARGFQDSTAANFPCGGFNTIKNRTDFPMGGGPLQLNMEHPQTNIAVYIAIGANPGDAYNTVLRHTFTAEVLGSFCVGDIALPNSLNVSDGTPATIQVVTNGDPSGGLYQCADVTLRTAALSQSDYSSHCSNQTNAKVTEQNIQGNPNETTSGGSSPSPTGAAATTTAHKGFAAHQTAASWAIGAIGLAGLALL